MVIRCHREEVIAKLDRNFGRVDHLSPSQDNRHCVIVYMSCPVCGPLYEGGCQTCGRPGSIGLYQKYVLHGRVFVEGSRLDRNLYALSSDGCRLATCQRSGGTGCWHYEVRVNGRIMWIGPDMFFVCRLAWLRDGRLAWDGWTENEINVSSRTYVEGQVVDDESILDELGVSGSRVLKKLMLEHDFDTTKAEEPWLVRDNDQKTVRVSYRGQLGPEFHEVTSGPFLSEDRQRCAYAGVRYAKWARRSQYLVERIGESQMHSGLLGLVFGWPAWLLFNRDFGAGHAASESSKRYHPVCGEREWTKSYLHANVDFFTSEGSLVVTASDKDGWHVVIDEDEGPAFDHVQNVLRIPGGGVCYLAVRDDKILRVVVK